MLPKVTSTPEVAWRVVGPFGRVGHDDTIRSAHDGCDVRAGVGDDLSTRSEERLGEPCLFCRPQDVAAGVDKHVDLGREPPSRDQLSEALELGQ